MGTWQQVVATAGALAILGACASDPKKVSASYVSAALYQNLTCEQLGLEATRVSNLVTEVTGAQRGQRTTDTVVTTVGVLVFWPALFFIGGDDEKTAELARLKGEMEAIEKASIQKNCAIRFHSAPQTEKTATVQ